MTNGIYDYTSFVNNGKYNMNIYTSSHGQLRMWFMITIAILFTMFRIYWNFSLKDQISNS
jgi:hypothetical protein